MKGLQASFSIFFHVHTSLERVHAMYIPVSYIKCTNSYVFAHIQDQQKATLSET